MKNLKQLFAAILLALVLGIPAYAGDMATPTIVAPPPPDNSAGSNSSPAFPSVSEDIVLDLILGVISLP